MSIWFGLGIFLANVSALDCLETVSPSHICAWGISAVPMSHPCWQAVAVTAWAPEWTEPTPTIFRARTELGPIINDMNPSPQEISVPSGDGNKGQTRTTTTTPEKAPSKPTRHRHASRPSLPHPPASNVGGVPWSWSASDLIFHSPSSPHRGTPTLQTGVQGGRCA